MKSYSIYSPNLAAGATREVIGIVTQIDDENARPDLAKLWLRLVGCKKIFHISSYTGEGIAELFNYLREDNEIMPCEKAYV